MVIETVARVHADKAIREGSEYYNYMEYKIQYGDINKYKICEYIGKGKYSQVFRGIDRTNNKACVIKVLKPIRKKNINREAKVLHTLKGAKNVVELIDIVREEGNSMTQSFVFAYKEHRETRALFSIFTIEDVKYYSRKILETLAYVHTRGIMHRDIKPQNIVINHTTKEVRIIDWGLAEYYIPQHSYSIGVGSMSYKAPELLVNYKTYDYGIDIWAFGCVFAEMIMGMRPMFNGRNNQDQLERIVQVLGTDKLKSWCKEYDITLNKTIKEKTKVLPSQASWKKIEEKGYKIFTAEKQKEDAFVLLRGMLEYNHQKRMTAEECLQSAFLAE